MNPAADQDNSKDSLTSVPLSLSQRLLENCINTEDIAELYCYLIKLLFLSDCSDTFESSSWIPLSQVFLGLFDKPLTVQSSVKAQT